MKVRSWLITGALVGAAVFAWHRHDRASDSAQIADGQLDERLTDRLWIDHMPTSERDLFNVFMVMSEQPVGVFQKASAWQGQYEIFRYRGQGSGSFGIEFPHTGDRSNVRAKVSECHQGGMDYCLEISGSSRGVKRYYSREDWGAKSVQAGQDLVDRLSAPPFGGAARSGEAGPFDRLSAPPFGGAARSGEAGPFDRLSAPPFGGAARSGEAGPFDRLSAPPFGGAARSGEAGPFDRLSAAH